MGFVLLKDLNSAQQNSKIKVRISRIWEAKTPQLKNDILSLECLLIDEEGYTMQASIRKNDAKYFKALIEEGFVYSIENFILSPTKNNYVVVCQKHVIQLSKWTRVVKITDNIDNFPLYSFSFVEYDYIMTKKQSIPYLIDVIGTVVSITAISHTYVAQQQTPLKKLQLQNLENNNLSITLWDNFALDFENQLLMYKEKDNPIVVVFASMTTRTYRDEVYLSTCSASRMYINLEIPKVIEFRNALQAKQLPIEPIRHMEVSNNPILTPHELMIKNRISIADLLALDASSLKETRFTCKAKLVTIDTSYGWWYKACSKCKSAMKDYADVSLCGRCGEPDPSPVPWYKLDVNVEDETASTNFMIFGKLAQDLIHIPAQQLAVTANVDKYVLPSIFKKIIGETYVFQISVDTQKANINGKSFKVTKIFLIDKVAEEQNQASKKRSRNIGEATDENPVAQKSKNVEIEEIVEDFMIQSASLQSTWKEEENQKGKKPSSLIDNNTSEDEES